MEEPIGILASIINAVLFFFLSLYIIFIKKDKDPSHYFFLFMTISLSLYGLTEIFKYSENYEVALHLSRISPIFVFIALYFFVLFTFYLRIGINKEIFIFLIFPLIFIAGITLGPLIDDVEPSIYGWIPIFNGPYLAIYFFSLLIYFIMGIYNLLWVYGNINTMFKTKILYFVMGALIVLLSAIIQIIEIIFWRNFIPLLDISFFISGIMYFYALIR